MLVLRMSDCPSPTLTAQPESGTANAFHLLNRGSMVGPRPSDAEGVLRGDLVVPTGWRRWGSIHGFSFLFPHFAKGLKEDSASSCSQGPT
ncbi:hypothetical protein OIU77_001173 [Salix suchowensis]|uniref:Uncharacterized protein n=1 Tax=Salix suchowensis TaxID=1278906 RepID=A0ABQ8ZG46_9ROSI|nr:hypothetical protein OIU77_001173 [Salix suchowensis]